MWTYDYKFPGGSITLSPQKVCVRGTPIELNSDWFTLLEIKMNPLVVSTK